MRIWENTAPSIRVNLHDERQSKQSVVERRRGPNPTEQFQEACEQCLPLAGAGDAEAQMCVGWMHQVGEGAERKPLGVATSLRAGTARGRTLHTISFSALTAPPPIIQSAYARADST